MNLYKVLQPHTPPPLKKKNKLQKAQAGSSTQIVQLEPQQGSFTQNLHLEPQPGTSTRDNTFDDDSADLCKMCVTDKNDEWILCDSCNEWYHRKYAGLKNASGKNTVKKEFHGCAKHASKYCQDL